MQARIDTAQAALRNISKALQPPTKLPVRFYMIQRCRFANPERLGSVSAKAGKAWRWGALPKNS